MFPDYAGIWICLQTLALLAITSRIESGKSLGCGLVKRKRISGAASETMSIKSAKRAPEPSLSLNISEKPAELAWDPTASSC